jgi:universal stress protein A
MDIVMGYRHVLAAVDLSEEATQVLDKARAVASASGATLSVVSVVKPILQVYGALDMAPIAIGGVSFEQQALDQATTQTRTLGARYGIPETRVHVFLGTPAPDVRALAKRIGADLIVVGTHARHGLGLLLGSTANAIIHGVTCDVLAVRMAFEKTE